MANEEGFYLHPLFTDIESGFRFFLLSLGMLSMKSFQDVAMQTWPTLTIYTTVSFNKFSGLTFASRPTIDQFNKKFAVIHESETTRANLNDMLQTQAKLMTVYIFESIYQSVYQGKISRELDNFLYHIRNAAAHNNLIDVKKRKGELARWREKVIDESTNGKVVFNEFMTAGDVILLMIDISDELRKIDH